MVASINRLNDHDKKVVDKLSRQNTFRHEAMPKLKICSTHNERRTCRTSMAPVATRCRRRGEEGSMVEM